MALGHKSQSTPTPTAHQMPLEVRPLTAADCEDAARLHRFAATSGGGSVFGGCSVADVLAAAAAREQG